MNQDVRRAFDTGAWLSEHVRLLGIIETEVRRKYLSDTSAWRVIDERLMETRRAIELHLQLLVGQVAAAPAWQPIAGAPMDGTEVLVWRADCGQFIASYTHPAAMPLTQDEIDATDVETLFDDDWFTQWPDARRMEGSEVPTLYMPLPADPEAKP